MLDELIEFWKKCDLKKPPFVHPGDWDIINSQKPGLVQGIPSNYARFVERPEFTENKLHLHLVPQPYAGNLKNAEIVILLINPGLGYTDYWGESEIPSFRERLEDNLLQRHDDSSDFPFMWLDPSLCWHGGFIWWEKKLQEVINTIAIKRFDGNYRAALSAVSKKIASVELVPYHSFSFGAHSLINRLPSVRLMHDFVRKQLVPKAIGRKLTLIVTRQVKTWSLPSGHEHIKTYSGGQSRSASLTSKSPGGQVILRAFGISADESTPLETDD
jgi:hypothetical protein